MIYFDNAATTNYKPKCVIDAMIACASNSYNANRTASKGAIQLQQKIHNTRLALSALLGNDSSDNVVFTHNTTHALNLAILGNARKGGHIIITATEHNSVIRPVMSLYSKGLIDVDIVYPNEKGEIESDTLTSLIRDNTYMVVINHASNVTGTMQDLTTLGRSIRKAKGDILVLYDCAQSIGYTTIDMTNCCGDLVAIPAHKGLHGLQGCGALIFNNNSKPRPILLGGTGTESDNLYQPSTSPDGLESGTLNSIGIVALYTALGWWASNYHQICKQMQTLNATMIDGLNSIPNVQLYSKYNCSGIASFAIAQYDSNVIADILSNKYNIVTRAGLHCAPLMHKYLGTTNTGLVRASVAMDNSLEQVYYFLNRIDMLARKGAVA